MPQPDLRITHNLGFEKRTLLADALVECPSLKKRSGRDDVVDDLEEIGPNINRDDAPKNDLINIVRACEKYPGGLERLLKIVKVYNEKTKAVKDLEKVELAVFAPLTLKLLDELKPAIGRPVLSPDTVRMLYLASLPPLVPAPAEPLADPYQATLHLLQYQDPLRALGFVERLADETGAAELRQWVEKAAAELNVSARQLQALRQQGGTAPDVPGYLLVQLRPAHPKADTFTVQVWYWKSKKEVRVVLVDDQPRCLTDIDTLMKQEKIAEIMEEDPRLTVELIVPRQLFSYDLSRMRILIEDMETVLITQNPVVLRWLNRFERYRTLGPRKMGIWGGKWQELRGAVQQGWDALFCSIPTQDHYASTDQLLADLRRPGRGLCVGFGFVPSESPGPNDLLTAVLNAGTPIIFWFRQLHGVDSLDDSQLKKLFCECQPTDLPKHVYQLRSQAMAKGDLTQLGYHLTLLYDDFDRVPPMPSTGAPVATVR